MADVLLVYPKAGHDVRGVSVNAPLAMLSIASELVPDFSVTILDQRTSDSFWRELEEAISQRPKVIGLSSMSGTQIYYAIQIAKWIKQRSDALLVWGGMHATLEPHQTAVEPYVDVVVRGEGERVFRKIVEQVCEKKYNPSQIPSLTWQSHGKLFDTPDQTPLELNKTRPLPWHLVKVEEYVSPAQFLYGGIHRLLPFEGSRGCPFKCTYCSQPALTKKYRMMDPDLVVERCLDLKGKYNLDHIAFFDDEFFVNRKWAEAVAERISGQFTWWTQTRAQDLLRLDLKKLERQGLRVIAPGLESGSDRILKYVRKGENVEEYREANRRLSETGLTVQYNFMVGFPTETASERRDTVKLIVDLLKENPNAIVNNVSPVTPLPGTEMYKTVIDKFDFERPESLEGWIKISRGRQEKPWLSKRDLKEVRFLYYTSYFLCTAKRYAQHFFLFSTVLGLYSKSVQFRWKARWLWCDFEIPLIRLLFRLFINPVDYKRIQPKDARKEETNWLTLQCYIRDLANVRA